MTPFELHILGCGSALPTKRHVPTCQVLDVNGKLFMIDCGEGAQLQFRQTKLNYNKILHVFISHLHGDHCFGLLGLISTMGLLGRHAPLTIHAHPDLTRLLQPQLAYFCRDLTYDVQFEPFDPAQHALIYEDRQVAVYTIPLKHRIPTAGFLFQEKERPPHVLKEMITAYEIPLKEIPKIKDGADFVTSAGESIPNRLLTKPADPPRSYAFCSDTCYTESIIPYIHGVNLLYHEATFGEDERLRAESTFHSTAAQAGQIARAAHVKRLLIGHYSARYLDEQILLKEARAHFEPVILAAEGMKCVIE
jgi:ribonuclease Z